MHLLRLQASDSVLDVAQPTDDANKTDDTGDDADDTDDTDDSFLLPVFSAGAGDRELGCIKCLPCSSFSRSSFGALAPLLLVSAFVLSHFSANSYTFAI